MFETLVRMFLYYPTVIQPEAKLPAYIHGAEEVYIQAENGNCIHGLYWPAPVGRPTILFFHGNAQTVFEWALITEELDALECGLLLVDYPGYGKSTGKPKEEALYAAGRGAVQWLVDSEKIPENRVVVFGKSLGGPVAAEVAQRHQVMGLILESTFCSIPAMIKRLVPFMPKSAWLTSERYDTASKVNALRVPVLIVQGSVDTLVQLREAQTLYAQANEPKQFYVVQGAGHNDVALVAGKEYGLTLRRWLDGIGSLSKKIGPEFSD